MEQKTGRDGTGYWKEDPIVFVWREQKSQWYNVTVLSRRESRLIKLDVNERSMLNKVITESLFNINVYT